MAAPVTGPLRAIPLESCYATPGVRGGCKLITDGGREPHGFDLSELYRENLARGGGAMNVALVRGGDIAAAVKATRRAFAADWQTDTTVPASPNDGKGGPPLWLVAYFGCGSSHPGYGWVQAVEVRGQVVRVAYAPESKDRAATQDTVFFYLWAPLGRAGAGTYALELFDADKKEVTLLRHVAVAGS